MKPDKRVLEHFLEIARPSESWRAPHTESFVKSLQLPQLEQLISNSPLQQFTELDRARVAHVLNSSYCSDDLCALTILVWGGIRRDNARRAFLAIDQWRSVFADVRRNALDRRLAYDLFAKLRPNKLPGVGPAYYTKFIYFLTHNRKSRGYIMDQWTSLSINIIYGRPLIQMNKGKTGYVVSDRNSGDNYDCYCSKVEEIADHVGKTPDEVELMLFSEGRGRGLWREFVKKSYPL